MNIITYELNEVPYRVLETYAARFPHATLTSLLKTSRLFNTYTEDEGILSPWITWPTLHRGVTNQKHCISDFGQDLQDVNVEYPSIIQLLAQNGVRVGAFGSLHTYPVPQNKENYAFYVPDTFSAGKTCFPEQVEAFQALNLAMVDRSGRNVSNSGLPKAELLSFLAKLPTLGVSPRTIYQLTKQVLSEQLNANRKVRRRTSQTQVAFDVFMRLLKKNKPAFATYFTNHVASSMHRYWPGLYPADYQTSSFEPEWLETYGSEVFFTMHEANYHLSQLKRYVDDRKDTYLLILSSMGQAAVDGETLIKNQLLLKDKVKFMQYFGLSQDQWSSERAMSPRFVFRVHDAAAYDKLKASLQALTINGVPLDVKFHTHGVVRIKLGQANLEDAAIQVALRGKSIHFEALGMENTFIEDSTASFAYHVPEGSCMVYHPNQRHKAEATRPLISTTEIAPAILSAFGVHPPAYMEKSKSNLFH